LVLAMAVPNLCNKMKFKSSFNLLLLFLLQSLLLSLS